VASELAIDRTAHVVPAAPAVATPYVGTTAAKTVRRAIRVLNADAALADRTSRVITRLTESGLTFDR